MLKLSGQGKAHTCDGMTRRDVLQVGALGAVGLTLPQYMALQADQDGFAGDPDFRDLARTR